MRGDLTPAQGFTNVKTDVPTKTVSFNYAKSETDMKAKLDELATKNSHLRDWKKKG